MFRGFMKRDEGITTIEIVLLLVVLIALVLIFKDQATDLIESIFETVTNQAMDV
ncbi:MAG: Flp1 family type IVb pilin [Lachnospiraceae bacterium]